MNVRRQLRFILLAALITAVMNSAPRIGVAVEVGFDTFTVEAYQPAASFFPPDFVITDLVEGSGDALVTGELTNSYPTVFYNDADVIGSRVKYLWNPGADDDLAGFVLGYNPGDTANVDAGFLVFDWKRVEQEFDFVDPAEAMPPINDSTVASTAPAAFRAAWISGVPSSDELWGKEDQAGNTFGGVTAITNGINFGASGYTANQSYVLEIEYAADQLSVFVDGALEFDLTPADVPISGGLTEFPTGRFGLYEAFQSPGAIASQMDIRPLSEASAPDPQALPVPDPVALPGGIKAFRLDVINEDAASGASTWSVAASTGGDNQTFVFTAPNNGDVDLAFGPSFNPDDPRVQLGLANPAAVPAGPADGVMLATVAENGPRMRDDPEADPIFGTVEAPWDSGFGGVNYGLAIAETGDGSESTTTVAAAFFPYTDRWWGGLATPDGTLQSSNGPVTVTQLAPPAPSMQNGLYNVAVDGRNSQSDGLLLVVGGSNENNIAAATPLADGTWNVSVRDNFQADFSGPETFEADDFNFLYLDAELTENAIGGLVTGFDETTQGAELAVELGEFNLSKEATGQYRLSIPGDTPDDGVLLLTSAESLVLSDDTVAPTNYYMTYQGDGSDFLIEVRQLNAGEAPSLVDGAFAFAFVGYDGALQAVPEPASCLLILLGLGGWWLTRRR